MKYRSLFILPLLVSLSACSLPSSKGTATTDNADTTTNIYKGNNPNDMEAPNEQEDGDDHAISSEYATEIKRFVEELNPNETIHYCDEGQASSSVRSICTPDWCKSDVNIYEVRNGGFLYHVFSYIPTRVLGVVEYRKEFDSYTFNAAIPYVEKNLTEFNPQFSGSLHLDGKTDEGHLLPWTKVSTEAADGVSAETEGNICVYDVHNSQGHVILSIPFKDKGIWTEISNDAVYSKQYEEEIWTLRISDKEFVNHYPVITLVSSKAVTKYGSKNNKKVTDRKLSETVVGKYTYVTDADEYFMDK